MTNDAATPVTEKDCPKSTQAGAQSSSEKKPSWLAAIRAKTDSLVVQLVLILLFGMSILQINSFLVVCDVQRSYVRQAERGRAEYLVIYWMLHDIVMHPCRDTKCTHVAT